MRTSTIFWILVFAFSIVAIHIAMMLLFTFFTEVVSTANFDHITQILVDFIKRLSTNV